MAKKNISIRADATILVTGGSGLVGLALREFLPNAQYPDSLRLNLLSENSIRNYFRENHVTHVVHLAAHVGSLHDNISDRIPYFDKNIIMNTLLTTLSYEHGVQNFTGILSTCIYPDKIQKYPITEDQLHNGAPHRDLMGYAYAKRSHAVQIDSYRETYGVNYHYLIPTNMYGLLPDRNTRRAHFVNDLISKIISAKRKKEKEIILFGDGTPLRQFMLASDFARFISEYIALGDARVSMNVAPEANMTIAHMAERALTVAAAENIEIKYDPTMPNGQFRKDVCTFTLRQHFPNFIFTSFEDGLRKVIKAYEH